MYVGQKKSGYPFAWLLLVLLFLFLLNACKKDTALISNEGTILLATGVSPNLVKNPSFTEKDSKQQLPLNWTFNFEYDDLTGVNIDSGNISWQRNSKGRFLVSQDIAVNKNRFYKVVMKSSYTVNDFSPFGIYVSNDLTGWPLGKLEKVNKAGSDPLEILINSGEHSRIKLEFGFPENMNANVEVNNLSIQEIIYDPAPVADPLAAVLVNRLGLLFTKEDFDKSVRKLCDYVNELLISAHKNSGSVPYLLETRAIIHADTTFHYTNENLENSSVIDDQYCQRSSLTLTELLNNSFHIPVRQVHLMFGDTGKHQFIEYWNPFSAKWIAIDPYFSGQFTHEGKLLGAAEVDSLDPGSGFQRFGAFVFEPKVEELETLWSEKDSVRIDPAYYLSYPFN